MDVVDTIAAWRARLDDARERGATVGLVPTMGYLHQGHVSLMRAAVADGCVAAVTIFVNPLQFAAGEDLSAYPRDLDRDLELCAEAGVSHVLAPSVEEMYPRPMLTTVSVAELSQGLEGASRPTHFAGVATVVAKLFNLTGPCRAYFGEKDFQQLAVVTRMAADLSAPVEVVGCPIVREADGLAMSSRNVYLTDAERQAALVLYRALQVGERAVQSGTRQGEAVVAAMAQLIDDEPLAALDYAVVVDPRDLRPQETIQPGADLRLLVAAKVGRPRLLDNVGVTAPS